MSASSPLTRRRFLQGVALAPAVASATVRGAGRLRVVVIGAGAFGGWTAWHLLLGGAEVTLVDAWGPGNPRASSGGESRVIRGIYGPDRIYTELVRRAFELWEELDATVAEPLYVPTGALWMMRGGDEYVRSALPILAELGFPVEEPSLEDGRRRWPQIDFSGVERLYLERRAGALSARLSCLAVRDRFVAAGGRYRTARALPGPIAVGRMRELRLEGGGRLEGDAFVFACGPWLGEVLPEAVGDRVQPTRQEVYYFGPPAGSETWGPARLPVWIDFGERVLYGLPDVHGRGFKLADDTRGAPIDPTTLDRRPSQEGLDRARLFLARRFPELATAPLVESRVCQYENSPDGHLLVDRHPRAENVWLAGGGSGHGFKLGPAVGEVLAAAVLGGPPLPDRFGLARLEQAAAGTQFESGGDG